MCHCVMNDTKITRAFQAFIVSFTSDMIPRLVYLYTFHSGTEMSMKGYISNSLSVFNISEFRPENRPEDGENPEWFYGLNVTTCRSACHVPLFLFVSCCGTDLYWIITDM